MADNVSITAGSGTTISTEEITNLNGGAVSAQHAQRIIPATRTADGTAIDEAAGAGAVSTATKRVTIATDDTVATDLTAIKTAIQIIDDWDESDRAKVNPIVGQAGVAAGAGAVGTTTQRVTLASDDPAVTSLQLIDDAIIDDDAAFTPATTKVLMSGFEYDDTTPDSVNEGDAGAARMSANRNVYTQIRDAAGNERGLNVDTNGEIGVSAIRGALPAGTNAIGKLAANSGVDIGDVDITSIAAGDNNIGNVDVVTLPGTGVEDAAETAGGTLLMAGTVRRDTAASSAGTTGDNATLNTDATGRLWTTATVTEDVAHSAGETLQGNGVRRIDTPATSAGTSGDWATLDASAEGALWVTQTPTKTGGLTTFRSIDLDETEEDVKTSAGNLYGYYFANTNASARYLKFYNATAASVSVGTTTPSHTFYLPPTSAGHVSFPVPIGFSTALSAAATTGVADSDTGAPGANEVLFMAFYK